MSEPQAPYTPAPIQTGDIPSYQPVVHAATNSDMAAVIQAAVQQALDAERAAIAAANAPRVVTPEEAARAALDNAGAGLGIDERLAELYRHLATVAAKVGI